ncbi:AzlC family ABC transporter permease [Halalkalibacter nanhaiisediminis]|uniref:4-azaleucine resistance transporter AzlC n=1 Tax=Halalkalibacter nanhaiisediminis TaxID=688079 RepID=A0A562QK94_9BACI|nr:AzlC family ABC transporter permease [Halalkalibacter nanhaiisediminis]TWI57198.1 4-azaleucine resistance transporter AzlC [Halalkalibacter nanhaiisediminis]
MSTTVIPNQKSSIIQGMIAGSSIAIGYLPAALTFGLLAKSTGLTLLETVAMSVFVFAGAAQYMALNLIALGTGAFEIIFTTFIVNIRHLLMSASVGERVEDDHLFIKALYSFGITDEVFAVTTTREGTVKTGFVVGVAVMAYVSWVVNSGLGYVVGAILPVTLQESMGIALYAMFIALLIPSLKKQRKIVFLAVSAAIFNSLFSLMLPSGWSIIAATLLASAGIEWITRIGDRKS